MGRIISLVILFLFIIIIPGICGSPDSLFEAANELYYEDKFEEAAETYHRILELGYTSPEVLYNLGNAYFRSNKLGKARLYYEKSLLLSPADQAIKTNLAYVKSILTDSFEEVPVFFLRKWIINLRNSLSPDSWAITSLIIFAIALALLVIFLFTRRILIKKLSFYPGISFFFISFVCLAFAISSSRNMYDSGTAIITVPSVLVKSSPRDSGRDLFILHEGAKVWIENTTGDWKEIRISDGRIGWLPGETAERI